MNGATVAEADPLYVWSTARSQAEAQANVSGVYASGLRGFAGGGRR